MPSRLPAFVETGMSSSRGFSPLWLAAGAQQDLPFTASVCREFRGVQPHRRAKDSNYQSPMHKRRGVPAGDETYRDAMESSQKNSSNRLHPLLRDLPEELLLALNDCSTQSRFAAGKVICEAGKPASRILLIQEGQVSLEVTLGGTTQVGILGPGDFLGCPWFGEKHDWPVTARALGEVTAQSIFASRLQELFEASPQAGKEFALRLARGMDEQLAGAHNQIARVSRLALESQVMALEAFAEGDTKSD